MSILQDYEKHRKWLGDKVIEAIDLYIQEMPMKNRGITYSKIIYNEKEFKEFKKWLSEQEDN